MDLFHNLAGFGVVSVVDRVTPDAIRSDEHLLCLIGALVGTLIGVLPGIGPLATIAMLLPITFGLPPVGALIMLAGIYYGAQYGGSTTSILINIPGEVVLGGHDARRPPDGEAGPRRPGARDRGDRLVHRRLRLDRAGRGARRAAHLARAAVRPGGIFLADGARPRVRGRARQGLGPQGASR